MLQSVAAHRVEYTLNQHKIHITKIQAKQSEHFIKIIPRLCRRQWKFTCSPNENTPSPPPPPQPRTILRVVPICVFVHQSVPVSRKVIKLIACFTTQQQQLRAEKITPNFRLEKKKCSARKSLGLFYRLIPGASLATQIGIIEIFVSAKFQSAQPS